MNRHEDTHTQLGLAKLFKIQWNQWLHCNLQYIQSKYSFNKKTPFATLRPYLWFLLFSLNYDKLSRCKLQQMLLHWVRGKSNIPKVNECYLILFESTFNCVSVALSLLDTKFIHQKFNWILILRQFTIDSQNVNGKMRQCFGRID